MLLQSYATGSTEESIISVDASGNGDFSNIEDAIYNAFDGDTIVVYPGTYTENLVVKKSLTIKSYSGNPGDTIIKAALPEKNVFQIFADGVNITGFKIMGAQGDPSSGASTAGIQLEGVYDCKLNNNIVTDCKCGIVLTDSRYNLLENNVLTSNKEYGIMFYSSYFNTLSNNLISGSQYNFADFADEVYTQDYNYVDKTNLVDGKPIFYLVNGHDTVIDTSSNAGTIYCINCENISIKDLQLTNNQYGIYLFNTFNSTIANVNSSNNFHGFFLYRSQMNNIENNYGHDNTFSGISLTISSLNLIKSNTMNSTGFSGIEIHQDSNNNKISDNIVTNNDYGIEILDSSNNELKDNIVESNEWENIYTSGSSTGFYLEKVGPQQRSEEETKTIHVKPGNSIQEAIDSANPGDTIIVHNGSYRENIDVNKEVIIVSESGKPEETRIYPDLNEGPFVLHEGEFFLPGYGFYITADNVTVSGFYIGAANANVNGSTMEIEMAPAGIVNIPYGIVVDPVQNCTISNNMISSTISGVIFFDSDNCIVEKNIISNSLEGMVFNDYCDSNTIIGNLLNSNEDAGIMLDNCRSNQLLNNTVKSSGQCGLLLHESTGNMLRNNTLENKINLLVLGYNGKYRNDIDTSNLANGTKIYYLVDKSDYSIDQNSEAGVVYCIGCRNISVNNLELEWSRIFLYNTVDSVIENNVFTEGGEIFLEECRNNKINGNRVSHGGTGIELKLCRNNIVENNTAYSNDCGISSTGSNNILVSNVVSDNRLGISLGGNENSITNNTLTSNENDGISVSGLRNELISNQITSNGQIGVYLSGSSNHLYSNNISENANGIFLVMAEDNTIIGNDVCSNDEYGVQIVTSSSNNTLIDNLIKSNGLCGLNIQESTGNILYNNLFENNKNVQLIDSPSNIWNVTPSMSSNVQNGTVVGGNFWAYPNGTGPSQIFSDTNQDSYCDQVYEIEERNIDFLPLIKYNRIYKESDLQKSINYDVSQETGDQSPVSEKKSPISPFLSVVCFLGAFLFVRKEIQKKIKSDIDHNSNKTK